MKRVLKVFTVIGLLFVLAACPVSTEFPLAPKGDVSLDTRLMGTWITSMEDVEAQQITIKKGTEKNTCLIHVDEKGEMFMADGVDFVAWLATVGGKSFMVLQQLKDGEAQETYYVYHLVVDANKLVTNDITLKVGGTAAITSIATYQEEVVASMKLDDFLAGEIQWTKK
jgi:hypothetical protein